MKGGRKLSEGKGSRERNDEEQVEWKRKMG